MKTKKLGVSALLFMAEVSGLSAGTITYVPAGGATSVPMSTEGMMGLAALFLLVGMWMLLKSKRGMGAALVIAGLATGFYPVDGKAGVSTINVYLSDSNGGSVTFTDVPNTLYNVENNSGVSVIITNVLPGIGAPTANQCTIGMTMADGESCSLIYPD